MKSGPLAAVLFLTFVLGFSSASAQSQPELPAGTTCAVEGVTVDCDATGITDAHEPNCPYLHFHGELNGISDPDPNGCGHGLVLSVAPGKKADEPSLPARLWQWLGSWFSDDQKETMVNVVDVVAESNGIPPPGTISDTVDIVKEATPSIKVNADNANEYFDTYEDAPDRDRYTLETENPEANAPVPSLYRWFWSWFE